MNSQYCSIKQVRLKKRPVEEDLIAINEDDMMIDEEEINKHLQTNDFLKKLGEDDPMPREYYLCDSVALSEKLIGKYLVRQLEDDQIIKGMIVETEAYKAPLDKASHAYNNRKTEKTKWAWQEGGHLYMYSVYGNNICMNIVSSTKNEPETVLIRAIEPIQGLGTMKRLRGNNPKMKEKDLTNGPGKLTQAFNIDKDFNGHDLTQKGKLYITKGLDRSAFNIETSKRINVDYAGEWKEKLWRFTLQGNRFLSK